MPKGEREVENTRWDFSQGVLKLSAKRFPYITTMQASTSLQYETEKNCRKCTVVGSAMKLHRFQFAMRSHCIACFFSDKRLHVCIFLQSILCTTWFMLRAWKWFCSRSVSAAVQKRIYCTCCSILMTPGGSLRHRFNELCCSIINTKTCVDSGQHSYSTFQKFSLGHKFGIFDNNPSASQTTHCLSLADVSIVIVIGICPEIQESKSIYKKLGHSFIPKFRFMVFYFFIKLLPNKQQQVKSAISPAPSVPPDQLWFMSPKIFFCSAADVGIMKKINGVWIFLAAVPTLNTSPKIPSIWMQPQNQTTDWNVQRAFMLSRVMLITCALMHFMWSKYYNLDCI